MQTEQIFSYMQAHAPEFVRIRHNLHEYPEVGLELTRTARTLAETLQSFGVDELHTGIGKTGLVAVVHGVKPAEKWIGIRADMDALPLTEEASHDHPSKVAKCTHACGHDGHMTMALAACRYLCEHRENFSGSVAFIFQPGEEGFAGARCMIEDGLFEKFPIEEVYATHGEPLDPVGTIGISSGYIMASADIFTVDVEGKGGHGAKPHEAIDSVLVASQIVVASQSIVSRNVDPLKGAVVTFGALLAGDEKGSSVLPQKAKMVGTTRTFEPEVRDLVQERLVELTQGVAKSYGAQATCHYTRLYPSLYNHPEQTDALKAVAVDWLGSDKVLPSPAQMIAEDFSFMTQAKPGCLFRTGLKDPEHTANLHHRTFDFNDKAIAYGATLFVAVALTRLMALNGY